MDIRGKEITPRETVDRAKKILSELGLIYEIDKLDSGTGTYSHQLRVKFKEMPKYIVADCNGKGITEEYSEASAFAEMIERISNMSILLNVEYFELNKYKDRYISLNEKLIKSKEINKLEGLVKTLYKKFGEKFWSKYKYIGNIMTNSEYNICIQMTEISDNSTCYVPFSYVIFESNGMCAGNTKEEALCQGIFELFERYALENIIANKMSVPKIPEEIYQNTESYKIIKEIEKYEDGRFMVDINDCSLGLGIPIVGIIIYDKLRKGYKASFGSSYSYEIALERCLTEIVQNYKIDNIKLKGINNIYDIDVETNVRNGYFDSTEYCPEEYMSDNLNDGYSFKGDINLGSDSKEIFNNIIKIIKEHDIKIYYFDNSFLGLNCYKIISPELISGRLEENSKELIKSLETAKNLSVEKLEIEEIEDKLNYFETIRESYGYVPYMLGAVNREEVEGKDTIYLINLMTALLNIKIGNIEEFIYYSNIFLNKYDGHNKRGIELLRCLISIYSYGIREVEFNDTINILSKIYNKDDIKTCLNIMDNPDKIIHIFGFFNRDGKGLFNLCRPEFYERYIKFIDDVNKKRIERGK